MNCLGRVYLGLREMVFNKDSHERNFEERAVFAGCGVRAVGTKELPVGIGGGEG